MRKGPYGMCQQERQFAVCVVRKLHLVFTQYRLFMRREKTNMLTDLSYLSSYI